MNDISSAEKLRIFYDFNDSNPRIGIALIPIIIIVIGVILMIHSVKTQHIDSPGRYSSSMKGERFLVGLIITIFSLLVLSIVLNLSDYNKTKALLLTGKYNIVEGNIENYNIKYGGKNNCHISFDINRVHFELNNNSLDNYGCESTDINNKGLRNEYFLRISYYGSTRGNKILKIEAK